ncbi:SWI/SNF-related matrix-associated actin-dependent regulator of chromatin subfamily E member 1 [Dirofilaria immitis]|nr:SWI/SNF-related matrix-associated actin-dependent regulator of chromatin subfamily E member 1 [Dirofilaria immitis]
MHFIPGYVGLKIDAGGMRERNVVEVGIGISMFRHPPPRPSSQNDSNSLKPPKPPDRPLVPYMRFSRKMWAKVRAENPESQLWDIGKVIGQMWRDAPESEKATYHQEYDIERQEYEKALKAYYNSAAYQQYLSAKNRAKVNDKSNTVGGVIAASRGRLDTGGVVIQPVEDEELGDLSSRRIAAVRFDRNHRLIADLFSGNVVTDTRTVLAQNRIEMLKKQATSLALHQFFKPKTFDGNCIRRIRCKIEKVCEEKPQLDETKYASMVDDWSEKLLNAYEEYKAKQEALRAKQIVEREQLAEETPILYRLTVGDSSPSPKNKTIDEVQSPQIITSEQQLHAAIIPVTSAANADTSFVTSTRTAIKTASEEETEKLTQDHQEQPIKKVPIGPPTLEVSEESL